MLGSQEKNINFLEDRWDFRELRAHSMSLLPWLPRGVLSIL